MTNELTVSARIYLAPDDGEGVKDIRERLESLLHREMESLNLRGNVRSRVERNFAWGSEVPEHAFEAEHAHEASEA